MRFLVRTVLVAVALLLLHALLVIGGGAGAKICSSDLQTNLLRIQSLDAARKGGCVVLGSSISGRLRSDHFDLGGRAVCVLGLDGLGAPFAARLLDEFAVEPAIVVVEANSLLVDNPGNAKVLLSASTGSARTFARWFPIARAEARPSAIVYSALKHLKDNGGVPSASAMLDLRPEAPLQEGRDLDALAAVPAGLEPRLRACSERGALVVLIMMPDGAAGGKARPREVAAATALATELGIPYYDLRTQLAGVALAYSDGLHLTEPSARAVAKMISKELVNLQPKG